MKKDPIFYDNEDKPVFLWDMVYPWGKYYENEEVKDYKSLACKVVMHEWKPALLDQWWKHNRIDCVESMKCTDEANWQDKIWHVFRPFYSGYYLLTL